MLVTKWMTAPIDFHSMGEKNTVKVNDYHQLFGNQHSTKHFLLVVKYLGCKKKSFLGELSKQKNLFFIQS